MEQIMPGAHHCNYSHRSEKFRAMKLIHGSDKFRTMKLITQVDILERQLFKISSLNFRAMMQSYEYQKVLIFIVARQRSGTLVQYFFSPYFSLTMT